MPFTSILQYSSDFLILENIAILYINKQCTILNQVWLKFIALLLTIHSLLYQTFCNVVLSPESYFAFCCTKISDFKFVTVVSNLFSAAHPIKQAALQSSAAGQQGTGALSQAHPAISFSFAMRREYRTLRAVGAKEFLFGGGENAHCLSAQSQSGVLSRSESGQEQLAQALHAGPVKSPSSESVSFRVLTWLCSAGIVRANGERGGGRAAARFATAARGAAQSWG